MDAADLEYLRSTYLYQPGKRRSLPSSAESWCPVIQDLIQAGYSFLPEQYDTPGFLFRGLRPETEIHPETQSLGHSTQDCEASCVERAMGVYFLTHEISDAISASGLHEQDGAAIAVIGAEYFNRQLEQRKAAIMAIGDSGFVFRYPFITEPLPVDSVDCIFTTAGNASVQKIALAREKTILLGDGNRRALENEIASILEQREISPSTPVNSTWYPH